MHDDNQTERPEPRPVEEIFEDLRSLAQSEGALHEISSLIYRDHFVTVDRHDGRVVDDPEYRWSTSKLNANEILLLLGLMVQSPAEHTFSVQPVGDRFVAGVDSLLHEFHGRVIAEAASTFHPTTNSMIEQENSIGLFAREAIYYGAAGFYLHQFLKFGRRRYRKDTEWLLRNVGISIRPMLEIAKFILDRINAQMTAVGHLFLLEMDQIIPWRDLCKVIKPFYPKRQGGRPPAGWIGADAAYSFSATLDPAVEEALYDSRAMRSHRSGSRAGAG